MAAATDLLDRARFGYLKPKDVARLAEAYRFSEAAHAGQTRQSGDPYISHPLAVAEILADWRLDGQTLMAALLHDVTEDTSVTKDEISDTFGRPVAELVDGVSKLDKIEFQSAEDAQAENFRKMLLAMARDVRVILIKLADRLHNMRTLGAVAPAKRRRVARETMEIYAPLAQMAPKHPKVPIDFALLPRASTLRRHLTGGIFGMTVRDEGVDMISVSFSGAMTMFAGLAAPAAFLGTVRAPVATAPVRIAPLSLIRRVLRRIEKKPETVAELEAANEKDQES